MRLLTAIALTLTVLAIVACGDSDDDPSASPTPAASRTSHGSPAPTRVAGPTATRQPAVPTPTSVPGSLAIVNARIIDGTGSPPIENGYIVVRDGRIVEVGAGAGSPPPDARIIDAGGRTVIPGLGDGHVHTTLTLLNPQEGPLTGSFDESAITPFLKAGLTDLRDVGTATIITQPIKERVDRLTFEGRAPRVTWAGPIVTTVGGYPFTVPRYSGGGQEVQSIADALDLVDRLAAAGVRIIKLGLEHGYYADEGWPVLDLETVQAITGAAHSRGLLVTAHVTSLDEVRLAIDGGVDDLAHTPLEQLPDDLIAEMVGLGMGIVTTATIWDPPAAAVAAENAVRYAAAGGIVAIGTDFGCCNQVAGGEAYLREAAFLEEAGFPLDALIVAATRNVALLANYGADLGTLEPGKLADIVIVDGDPLAGIGDLSNVSTVILGGQIVYER